MCNFVPLLEKSPQSTDRKTNVEKNNYNKHLKFKWTGLLIYYGLPIR